MYVRVELNGGHDQYCYHDQLGLYLQV